LILIFAFAATKVYEICCLVFRVFLSFVVFVNCLIAFCLYCRFITVLAAHCVFVFH